jgi:hypothetical protein
VDTGRCRSLDVSEFWATAEQPGKLFVTITYSAFEKVHLLSVNIIEKEIGK